MNRVAESFQGGVFSDATALGRVGVDIYLTPDGLEARTREGDVFTLLANETGLEIGGASGKMVFCRNADKSITIFSEAPGFLNALCQHGSSHLHNQASALAQSLKTSRLKTAAGWSASLLAIVLIAVFGLSSLRSMAQGAVQHIPWEVDESIGQTMIKQMDLGGPVLDNLVVQDAVNRVLQKLIPHSSRPDAQFEIHVVESEQVNAFALPGGQMVIFTGLIKRAEKAEEVAGVLAHEIAHVTQRHGIDRLVQSVGLMAMVQLAVGDASGLLALGSQLMTIAAINSYSRDQEREADAIGVQILHDAGISHIHLSNFFRGLEENNEKDSEETNELTEQVEEVLSWASTHPAVDERIEAIDEIQKTLPPILAKPLDIDWAAVHQALKEGHP